MDFAFFKQIVDTTLEILKTIEASPPGSVMPEFQNSALRSLSTLLSMNREAVMEHIKATKEGMLQLALDVV